MNYHSYPKIMKSLFMVHNETANIWIHLLGFFLIIFFTLEAISTEMEINQVMASSILDDFIDDTHKTSNPVATWPLLVMLFGGAVCLACSATYHLIYPLS